ncbi:hypothetical protein EV1_017471 [Malus domestica]
MAWKSVIGGAEHPNSPNYGSDTFHWVGREFKYGPALLICSYCSPCFLHVDECVARELREAKLKPLEKGRNVRIGVLAADAT